MTINVLKISLIGFFVFFLLITAILACMYVKYKASENKKQAKNMSFLMKVTGAFVIISGIMVGWVLHTIHVGYMHGMESTNISYKKVISSIKNSPVESTLPKDPKGCIVVYYRFNCKDCDATYHDIKSEFEKNDVKVYWVASRSKQGKELLKSYPVKTVPMGIYIRKNNYNDALSYTQKNLFTKTSDEKYKIDKDAIARLALLQKEDR